MNPPAIEILAANVRALIERVGSGAELARLTGVHQKTISRIANGENAVTLDTLNDLAKGAGLQPWQLLVPNLDLSNPVLLFQPDRPRTDRRQPMLNEDFGGGTTTMHFEVTEPDQTNVRISALDLAQRAYVAEPARSTEAILARAESYLAFLTTGKAPVSDKTGT